MIQLNRLATRRASELDSATRGEILASIAAALVLAAINFWPLPFHQNPLSRLGLAAVILWAAVTLYRFRVQIRKQPADLAAPGLVHYRMVMQRRRDHLRNTWIWHGPLILACLTLFATILHESIPNFQRLRNMLPFVALLILWIILGIFARRQKAAELQREIDELEL